MDMLGIENYTISGKAGNDQHIWNVVKINGDWYQVDVTWDDPLIEGGGKLTDENRYR